METLDDEIIRKDENATENSSMLQELKDYFDNATEEELIKEFDEIEMRLHNIDAEDPDAQKKMKRIRRKEKWSDIWFKARRYLLYSLEIVAFLFTVFIPNLLGKLIGIAICGLFYALILKANEEEWH